LYSALSFINAQSAISKEKIQFWPNYNVQFIADTVYVTDNSVSNWDLGYWDNDDRGDSIKEHDIPS
jgi:hypothetical protein